MNHAAFSKIAGRLLRCPAAPYHESTVRAEVEKICAEHGMASKRDAFGNVLVRLQSARHRPLVLAAHMDHPGFEIIRPLRNQRWRARFLGGVPDSYFKKGVPLRLMPGAVPAKLGKRLPGAREFEIHALAPTTQPPRFAVWELADFSVLHGRIHARACDDLIGVAAILATLIELKRSRARVHVIGVISRAEEVGFQGALTVAVSRQLPKNALVISLETSRELPPAKMGRGVVIRTGDRASIFDSTATRFLAEVAAELGRRVPSFQFQRALMYGGVCEGTAYQESGFQTAAVCVPLGNYHNCGARDKIAAEFVSLADACAMADLLADAARRMPEYARLTGRLPARLRELLREAKHKLL
jgi:endoglucanase